MCVCGWHTHTHTHRGLASYLWTAQASGCRAGAPAGCRRRTPPPEIVAQHKKSQETSLRHADSPHRIILFFRPTSFTRITTSAMHEEQRFRPPHHWAPRPPLYNDTLPTEIPTSWPIPIPSSCPATTVAEITLCRRGGSVWLKCGESLAERWSWSGDHCSTGAEKPPYK